MKSRSVLRTALAAILMVSVLGCSAFRSPTEVLTVNTSPGDAQVWINSNLQGTSPVSVPVRRNRPVAIMVRKDGYETATRTIDNHLSTTGILDIIGTVLFLLPGIGLFTAGAWDLDENHVTVQLFEK